LSSLDSFSRDPDLVSVLNPNGQNRYHELRRSPILYPSAPILSIQSSL
jgi:hypothetical protein